MFVPDQLVVYPAQGVGKVERLESQVVGGAEAEFYIVRILSNNVTLMVPVKNAVNVGLRALCSAEEGQKILDSLQDRSDFTGYTGQNWNRRYREYSEKLKSGSLEDVAYVLKELLLIGKDKELSFGERRLLEQSMGLITLELAHALDTTQEDVKARIEVFFEDVLHPEENPE
ncbi:transcriptional regulator, CarD family [Oleidesulfovibrio alaskensis G20]|uniref:Transcriptional regulator, CarD family n=1 Tax=Oleidesulfovibrio alaskensis (strain ATCC BAA-1058 / DSM 17464 / G20) TaxID=207559 RepID=Q30ZH0_OLEA2|nr:CarD family transcriptional regulator [Oleidesulfovibrio alaskensis]ABB38926.1 transcriptional regulator, CarD family [Oleidesulfovibrio alaskensis G20]MBG0772285.1 CarD family transcriptional regulator [Oleidesulfovibrio alaskensis]MBL3581063.1 CarD family transcriptional regulator [Oleidesulfovibrio alaskensis]